MSPADRRAGDWRTVRAVGFQLAGQHMEQRIVTKLIVIVQVFIAERQAEHALADQGLDRVLEQPRITTVSSMAYVLLNELRRIALRHTRFADATCGTIRLKLLKIGALVRRSVRRIKFAMASGFPWHNEFALAYVYLERAFPR